MSKASINSSALIDVQALILEGGLPEDGRKLAAKRLGVDIALLTETGHPDLYELDGADTKDQAERVRHMRAQAFTRPLLTPWRVFLIKSADGLSEISQNALLKIIEEPPPYVLFILLASKAEGLLPTVRSRCALHRMPPSGAAAGINPETDKQAKELISALNQMPGAPGELAVCAAVMGLTRLSREEFALFLESLLTHTAKALAQTPSAILDTLADTVTKLLDEQERNVAVPAACAHLLSQLTMDN
ncbi:MAG: hypothetical protein LBR85_04340 [Oscillospiraceae bacterium]|jgi:hypothetical protein|nr:hypothetical protein [Oscillospiraceae bacterium]